MILSSLIASLIFMMPIGTVDKPKYVEQIKTSLHDLKPHHVQPQKPKGFIMEDVLITYYDALCDTGCTGITATGVDVRYRTTLDNGYGVIAVDPNVIPLHSVVYIDGKAYKAEDTGGAIKGKHIDVLVSSRERARELGVTYKDVRIIKPSMLKE